MEAKKGKSTCIDVDFSEFCKNPDAILRRLQSNPSLTLVTRVTPKFGPDKTTEIELIIRSRKRGDCPELDGTLPVYDEDLSVLEDDLNQAIRDLNGAIANATAHDCCAIFSSAEDSAKVEEMKARWENDGPFPMLILSWENDGPYPMIVSAWENDGPFPL